MGTFLHYFFLGFLLGKILLIIVIKISKIIRLLLATPCLSTKLNFARKEDILAAIT